MKGALETPGTERDAYMFSMAAGVQLEDGSNLLSHKRKALSAQTRANSRKVSGNAQASETWEFVYKNII
jgi:hypothetical protein